MIFPLSSLLRDEAEAPVYVLCHSWFALRLRQVNIPSATTVSSRQQVISGAKQNKLRNH